MANPQRHAHLLRKAQERFHAREAAAAVFCVVLLGEEFQIGEHEIRVIEHACRRREVAGAGGVERGVDALALQDREELLDERGLKERFPAGDGDAALLSPVAAVAQKPLCAR